MSLTKFVGLLAFTAVAGTAAAASVEATNDTNAQIAELKKELAELKSQNGDKWLTEERASQIRGVVQDVMADADTRSSLQSTAATSGYNNGFFIASPDGNFKLQVNGQVQVRYSYSRLSNAGWDTTIPGKTRDSRGFEIRRAKLSFSGNVVDPSWQYKLTMAYLPAADNSNGSPYNVSERSALSGNGNGTTSTANLEDAYILKDFGNGWSLTMGQFKSPFLHEELVSSKNQLAVERSIVNQLFSTGWTDGVMLTGKNDNLMGMISFNNGGNNANFAAQNSATTNGAWAQYALTGRLQWLAFGNWNQFNDMTSMRGEAQGLMLGTGFNWQHGGNQNFAVSGYPSGGGSNVDAGLLTYTVDASWDLGGANIYGAFSGSLTDSFPGNLAGLGGNASAIQSYGAVIQGGYFITDNMELFARYEWYETNSQVNNQPINTGPTPFAAQNNTILTGGLNWYLNKNVKFTFDAGWANNGVLFTGGIYGQAVAGTNYQTSTGLAQGGQWVLRGQMQLVF